jgi:hypothetical protein
MSLTAFWSHVLHSALSEVIGGVVKEDMVYKYSINRSQHGLRGVQIPESYRTYHARPIQDSLPRMGTRIIAQTP